MVMVIILVIICQIPLSEMNIDVNGHVPVMEDGKRQTRPMSPSAFSDNRTSILDQLAHWLCLIGW